ncbi:MAG TPA: AMP-binding protein [Dermatophilaceae bacterium]|nr:AMP-binding protein [Dermatophilaceae bacterium]
MDTSFATPGRVTFPDGTLEPDHLLGRAAAVAERLGGLTQVAVHARPSVDTAVAVAGALLAGVPLVPVPLDAGAAEVAHVLRDSGAVAWVGTPSPADASRLPAVPVTAGPGPGARSGAGSGPLPPEPEPEVTGLVLYTSGTTGPPKGVLLSRRALAAGVDALVDAWAWTAQDRLVHGLPLSHVHGLVLGLLGPLRLGCELVHTGRPTPQAYAAARGSVLFGVPTVWHRVVEDEASARALADARLLVSGSASLPAPVFEALRRLTGQAPVERYGMSETLVTLSTRADGPRPAGAVGWPVAGTRTRLVDQTGEPVPHDGETVGRLQVRGPTVFDGYLGLPEATAAAWTADGWFATGDVATVDAEGVHRIVGRESLDLIKTGGFRVGAGEVEAALLAHPAVREAAVVGAPDADLGQRIVAHVVLVDGGSLDLGEAAQWVGERLSVHKRPRELRVVTELPRNEMGKVRKSELT